MEKIIETNIEGLLIKLNKVVIDERGFLAEMAPSGLEDNFFKNGVKNIYTSTAVGKHIARAGHFHYKNYENFYTISGTALWMFVDCRKESKTFNKTFSVILGSKSLNTAKDPVYTIDRKFLAQVLVPPGVYHIFWPLTEEPVSVVAIASESHNEADYEKPDIKSFSSAVEKLNEYGIVVS